MTPWRRFRLWLFLIDIRREHKDLVRSFEQGWNAEAMLGSMCTCMPGDTEDWADMDHTPYCRTWLI